MRRRCGGLASLALLVLAAGRAGSADAGWKAEADRRIERIRKGDFAIQCLGPEGGALIRAAMSADQTRSGFHFGTAADGRRSRGGGDGRYVEFIRRHFNCITPENSMKWYSVERRKDRVRFARADAQMRMAERHGLAVRGHCLLWSRRKFVQEWLDEVSEEELRRRVDEHVERMVLRYRGRLLCWDVMNEMLDGSYYQQRLGAAIRAHVFRKAHELDPKTPLFLNEYGILDSDEKTDRYIALIRELRRQGAPVGGIGIQEHAAERFAPDPQVAAREERPAERKGRGALVPVEVWRRLDRLGKLGLPIHLTEISAKTQDERRRADALEAIFRVGFAHPSVKAIVLWGFWGPRHWMGEDAALVSGTWRLTEAGRRIQDLLLREWRTTTAGRTDDEGTLRFRGFYGTYVLTAQRPGGDPLRAVVELTPDRRTALAILRPQGEQRP
jgi:GH35 family endo-1,4-beta-xylanase